MPVSNTIGEAPKTPKTWGSTGITGLTLHIPSGVYYHRYSIKGKRTYRSLGTGRFSLAKIKLAEKSGEVEKQRATHSEQADKLRTMGDLKAVFLGRLESAPKSEGTKINYGVWFRRIEKAWPGFFELRFDRIETQTILDLRTRLQKAKFLKGGGGKDGGKPTTGYRPAVVNQTLFSVKVLLDIAREKKLIFSDPFKDQKGVFGAVFLPRESKKPELPTHSQMKQIFAEVAKPQTHPLPYLETKFAEFAKNSAERVQFLALSGMRLNEGNATKWEDVVEKRIHAHGTKSASSDRWVPIIPAMTELLDDMRKRRQEAGQPLTGPILRGKNSLQPLGRACARLNLPKLTQHGLRHYFATICIESGVDVPTVSKWLGHSDGGAIAMRVYGHLRDEHSISAAQRVTIGKEA